MDPHSRCDQITDPSLKQLPFGLAVLVVLFAGFGLAPALRWQPTAFRWQTPVLNCETSALSSDEGLQVSSEPGQRQLDSTPMFTVDQVSTTESAGECLDAMLEPSHQAATGTAVARAMNKIAGPRLATGLQKWVIEPLGMGEAISLDAPRARFGVHAIAQGSHFGEPSLF